MRLTRALGRRGRTTKLCLVVASAATLTAGFHSAVAQEHHDAALRAYYAGNGLLNRSLHDLAATEYRAFLSEHADHEKAPVARYGLAVCLFRLSKFEEAARELEKLAALPEFAYAAEVGVLLGQSRAALGRHVPAAAAFAGVVEGHKNHNVADDATAGLCESLYHVGRYGESIQAAKEFVHRWADSALRDRVELFWSLSAMARADYEAATRRLEILIRDFPKSELTGHASLLLAQCYHRRNLVEDAVRQYRAVLARKSDNLMPEALLGLAQLLAATGESKHSGELLDELIKSYPENPLVPAAHLQRGRTWFDQGRYDLAVESLEKIAEHQRDLQDDKAYWLAKCRLRQGAFADAAAALSQLADRHPDSELSAEIQYDRAFALTQAKHHDEAASALSEFRSRFPDHPLGPDALHLWALTEHERRAYDKSKSLCAEFLRSYPSHALASAMIYLQGENDFLAGRVTEAADAFERFLKQSPSGEEALRARYRLGLACYRLDRHADAVSHLLSVTKETQDIAAFPLAWYALGDMHFSKGEWSKSQEFFEIFLNAGSDFDMADDALLKLGLSLQRQERHAEALAAFDRLLERFPKSSHCLQAQFERGQVLIAMERFPEGQRAFEDVLRAGEDSRFAPYAHNHLGAIALRNKRFDKAQAHFARATDDSAEPALQETAAMERALALLADGRYAEAESAFGGFLSRYPASPRAAEAKARQAVAVARQDRFEEALSLIEKAQDATHLPAEVRHALWYDKAWCLRKTGRDRQAAEVYRSLLSENLADSLRPNVLLELSEVEAARNRCDQAVPLLAQLRAAITANRSGVPKEVQEQGTYRLGTCLFETGDFAGSAEILTEFLKQFPTSALLPSALIFSGEALVKLGRQEQAVAPLTRVVDEYPNDPSHAVGMLRLGDALATLQRWAGSEAVFSDYLRKYGDSPHWYQAQFGLGWARENQQRYEEAMAAYRKVVDRHKGPTAARAQFQIGQCLFAANQPREAAAELLKVDILYAYPEWSSAALFEAGRCFEKLGQMVEARRQFDAVVERFGDTRWATLAAQRLAQLGSALPGR